MNFTIRKLHPSETDFLRDMFYNAIFLPEGAVPYPKSIIDHPELQKYTYNWGKPGDMAYAAEVDGKSIGLAWIRLFSSEDRGYGYIDDNTPELTISVKSGYRNQGIGMKLFDVLLEAAYNKGYQKISLSVDRRNKAVSLYKKIGFEIVRKNKTDYIMVKNINSSKI